MMNLWKSSPWIVRLPVCGVAAVWLFALIGWAFGPVAFLIAFGSVLSIAAGVVAGMALDATDGRS